MVRQAQRLPPARYGEHNVPQREPGRWWGERRFGEAKPALTQS
jgi:hypothetical protein